MEDKLINTECELRCKQASIGERIIWGTCIFCGILALFPVIIGGLFNYSAPDGTTAQIILSDNFTRLIIFLCIPLVIGLTAGIILVKTSVKSVAQSYFADDDD